LQALADAATRGFAAAAASFRHRRAADQRAAAEAALAPFISAGPRPATSTRLNARDTRPAGAAPLPAVELGVPLDASGETHGRAALLRRVEQVATAARALAVTSSEEVGHAAPPQRGVLAQLLAAARARAADAASVAAEAAAAAGTAATAAAAAAVAALASEGRSRNSSGSAASAADDVLVLASHLRLLPGGSFDLPLPVPHARTLVRSSQTMRPLRSFDRTFIVSMLTK
jgi:hypothetical protein